MSRAMTFFVVLLLSACTKPSDFRLDTAHRKIFEAGRDLSSDETIRVKISGLGSTQRLRFHKCASKECESAERVAIWTAAQVPSNGSFDVRVREPGKYYFWVEDSDPKYTAYDSDAVMVVRSDKKTSKGLQLEYNNGLRIVVKLVCKLRSSESSKKVYWIQSKPPIYTRHSSC
jgi:hypothetical protein